MGTTERSGTGQDSSARGAAGRRLGVMGTVQAAVMALGDGIWCSGWT